MKSAKITALITAFILLLSACASTPAEEIIPEYDPYAKADEVGFALLFEYQPTIPERSIPCTKNF